MPRLVILGEQNIDSNYHFAFSPTDTVELIDDQVEPVRTITVIPLTTVADSSTDFWFYDPYNHEQITRHVESAKVVPMPSDLKEMLRERAQTYPVLPDAKMRIKGTVYDRSYQRRDPIDRGVGRSSRVRSNVIDPNIVEVELQDQVEVRDQVEVESHTQVNVVNDVGSGECLPESAEN